MEHMSIRLMGDVALVGPGDVQHFESTRMRTLFALLALRAGHTVDGDHLIEEAWGEHPHPSPRAALHLMITRLRPIAAGTTRFTATGDGLSTPSITATGSGYQLDLDLRRIDLRVFLTAAHAALEGNDSARRDEAIALWREPVLPGLDSPRLNAARAIAEERRRALG